MHARQDRVAFILTKLIIDALVLVFHHVGEKVGGHRQDRVLAEVSNLNSTRPQAQSAEDEIDPLRIDLVDLGLESEAVTRAPEHSYFTASKRSLMYLGTSTNLQRQLVAAVEVDISRSLPAADDLPRMPAVSGAGEA